MNVLAVRIVELMLISLCVEPVTQFRYDAPQDCDWRYMDTGIGDVSLTCKLRTINSEFESTNFSVIPVQHTASLRIECSDALFFQSSLENQSFDRLIDLRELVIMYCKIAEIPETVFAGLHRLKNLTIRTRNTDWPTMSLNFHVESLKSLGDLIALDLGENNIWTFPPRLLCPLRSLVALNLTRNRFQEIVDLGFQAHDKHGKEFSTSQYCGLKLASLDLSYNNFVILPAYSLSALKHLQILLLQNNEISVMTDFTFKNLDALKVLNISNNKLVALPPKIFQFVLGCQEVYLKNNSLSVLAPGLFSGMDQLLILDMSYNDLTNSWITGDTFTDLIRLVVLNLSFNRLTRVESSVFRSLFSLQILNLEHNSIHSISENIFSSLYNLQTLILSANNLVTLDSKSLDGLFVLNHLALDSNRLEDIHPDAFLNSSSMQDLNLSGNQLKDVPEAVRRLKFLKTLDLGENRITSLQNVPFGELSQLFGLRLIDNQIFNITKETFVNLPSLKMLNLARNRIQFVKQGSFDANARLQAIRLDSNELVDISGLFSKLTNLIWLNVSDNQIEWFDFSLIPKRLQWLDIHKNRISELGNYYDFDDDLRLLTLDASFNHITELKGKSMPNSLELLFLNDNHISKIEAYAFFQNVNLSRVDLYANRLTTLDPSALRIIPRHADKPLPEFYIAGNLFQCDCTIEWLQKINNVEHLKQHPIIADINNVLCRLVVDKRNTLVSLMEADSSQFLCSYKTHCFALCHCCDFDACDCEMTCPTNCSCFHDQSWSVNIVDCSEGSYQSLPDRIPMDTTEAYLDGNDLGVLMSHSFIGRKNMRVLFLNNSNVQVVHNRTFNGLRSLKVLHLENNVLQELKGFEFDHLENLLELYLHNNHLMRVNNSTFVTLKSLEILTLSGNYLIQISLSLFSHNPSLTGITLSGNPWTCDCSFVDGFHNWLQENRKKVHDAEIVHCIQNASSALELNSSSSNLTCRQLEAITVVQPIILRDYLPLLLSTLSVFVVVLIVACLFFLFRQEVRVWAHAKCGFRICQSVPYDCDNERLYDAFVTYSTKDEMFVMQHLTPYLEHASPGYRLCLHHRDLPYTCHIADSILEGIHSSKRTILVLSKSFLQTEWSRVELKSALHQVFHDRQKRLIVIVVGEVAQRDLDPDMRLCLKMNPCLLWGEKLFWEKLRYALPDVKNLSPRSDERNLISKMDCSFHHCPHSNMHTTNSTMSSLNSPYWTIRSVGSPSSNQHAPSSFSTSPPPLPPLNGASRHSVRQQHSRIQDISPRKTLPKMTPSYQDYVI